MNQTVNKALLRELPYYSCDLISSHGQLNNSLHACVPTKKYLDRLPSFHDLDLFTLNSLLDKKSNDLGPILQPLGVNITLHTALPN